MLSQQNLLQALQLSSDWFEGKKTYIAGFVILMVDTMAVTDLAPIIPEQYRSLWMVMHGPLFVMLRYFTTGPCAIRQSTGQN